MKRIFFTEVELIAFNLTQELMSFNEPIPTFKTRFPNILESCVATPFQMFNKKSLYKGLLGKAAMLFYLMIKNHPFQNGNKRIAMTTLLAFFYKNKKWLKVDAVELYNFAVWVAQSPATLKDQVVEGIEHFLKKYLVTL